MDQSQKSESKSSATIFINPKFKAHINPNFFNNVKPTTANNIFVNPKFISNLNSNQNGNQNAMEKISPPQTKIIKQTNRNLIRQPMVTSPKSEENPRPTDKLIKIGRRKLVRPTNPPPNHDVKASSHDNLAKGMNMRSTYKIVNQESLNIYKIDRRSMKPARDRIVKRLKFFNDVITPKIIVTNHKLYRFVNSKYSSKANENNMLNINDVLYKSSKMKLQKQSMPSIDDTKSNQLNRISTNTTACSLYVRGEKFHLDASGKKLVRVSNSQSATTKNRIYLGGLTYIAKSNNTYERTNSHNTRHHLSTAKQKSINLLSKNLVKSNVSCLIYRKLGKCLGLQRGRCTKIHDPNQIAICPKFLKGSCSGEDCLLSHDTSLSKMPTCKFFLLGQCAKSDCQYLHKKVNIKTAICHDFLRGYCPKAEKCNLRHEFLCPNFESKNGCTTTRCPYVHKKKSVQTEIERPATTTVNSRINATDPGTSSSSTNVESKRYFVSNDQKPIDDKQSDDEASVKLGRALAKVACMKSYYNPVSSDLESTISVNTNDIHVNNDESRLVFPRKKLGTLPSFIPID